MTPPGHLQPAGAGVEECTVLELAESIAPCASACGGPTDNAGSRGGGYVIPALVGLQTQGLQLTGFVEEFGSLHRGPRWVLTSLALIIANGPA